MSAAKISTFEFEDHLVNETRRICEDHGWNHDTEVHRGHAFEIFVAQLFCQSDKGIDSDPNDSWFSTNDCKIDVILEDSSQKAIYLIQTKFPSPKSKPSIDEGEVNDFFARHYRFLDRAWVQKNASDEISFYLTDYKERLSDGYQFHYYFVSTGRASTDRTKHIGDSFQKDVSEDWPGVSFNLLDFYELKEFYTRAQSLEQSIPAQVRFQLARDSYITKSAPHKSIVAIVKGNALVGLYKAYRETLFAHNIRSYMGRRGINKDIIKTAQERSSEFYYFNNGVSAICTDFDVDENNVLLAENFQIINGAQTVGALSNASSSSEIEVILRLTRGQSVKTEKGFNADIIRYNNTQNIIKVSDFRSNDVIQLWLEKKFSEIKARGSLQPVSYIRKRTFGRAKRGSYALTLEDLAKIRYSFEVEPTRAVADPKSLWTFSGDGGVYEESFGIDNELVNFWPEAEWQRVLVSLIFYIRIESEVIALYKRDRSFIFLKRLRFFAVALAHRYIEGRELEYDRLIKEKKYFDDSFRRFWAEASRLLVDAHQQAVDIDKTTLFALARSEQRWTRLQQKFTKFLALPPPEPV